MAIVTSTTIGGLGAADRFGMDFETDLIDSLRSHHTDGREYLVLGTLESKTWRQGLSGVVTVEQVSDHMADFKTYMQVDVTPRHWSHAKRTIS